MIPGELRCAEGDLELNAGRETLVVRVVNDALAFDREAATGFRLDIPAGTSARFEPGASRDVALVALAGARAVPGLRLGT